MTTSKIKLFNFPVKHDLRDYARYWKTKISDQGCALETHQIEVFTDHLEYQKVWTIGIATREIAYGVYDTEAQASAALDQIIPSLLKYQQAGRRFREILKEVVS